MATHLATFGLICENYPEHAPLPGDKPPAAQKSKGINDLTQVHVTNILNAFNDPHFPLRFCLVAKEKKGWYYGCLPVIVLIYERHFKVI